MSLATLPQLDVNPSEYQKRILEEFLNTNNNISVLAAAGSGKTTTIRLITQVMRGAGSVLALCFNKHIEKEFTKKLPAHIEKRTFHSFGFKLLRSAYKKTRIEIDFDKPYAVAKLYAESIDVNNLPTEEERRKLRWWIMNRFPAIYPLVVETETDPTDYEKLQELFETQVVNLPSFTFPYLGEYIKRLRAIKDIVSFTDMIDLPIHYNVQVPEYKCVLVDEAQDLNNRQLTLLSRLVERGARLIAVGDRNQSIYAFRGARSSAMDIIRDQFGCVELPLSVCYRCGKAIIETAQEIVGEEEIQPYEESPDGIVEHRDIDQYEETIANLEPGKDMVLCRTNAPLIDPCFRLIRMGRKAVILGSSIGHGLIGIIKEVQTESRILDGNLADLLIAVNDWGNKKIYDLLNRSRPRHDVVSQVLDQLYTIRAIASECEDIPELIQKIKSIFSDQEEDIVLSTVHKAKGLERGRVTILCPDLMPHPQALKNGSQEMIQQEYNLMYVARTRAREHLIFQEANHK